MGCCDSKTANPVQHAYRPPTRPLPTKADSAEELARATLFSVSEVCALQELFKRVSNSMIQDGLIHRQEFHHALFKNNQPANVFFANRIFDLFDQKKNGVIEFGEFVRSLNVFHPKAKKQDKAEFAFKIYDLKSTGYIDKTELKDLVVGMLTENPDVELPEDAIKQLVDDTFREADLGRDDKIWPHEWTVFVEKYPTIINFMTLPVLRDLTKEYPSFAFNDGLEVSLEEEIEGKRRK